MIYKVTVNLPSLKTATANLQQELGEFLDVLAIYARERISFHAAQKLTTTHLDYQKGLQDPQSVKRETDKVTITLVGNMPNMLEQGFQTFDMKPGLLNSKKAKTNMQGAKYMDVPFRWGQPGATTMKPMSQAASTTMAAAIRSAKSAYGARTKNEGYARKSGHKLGIESNMLRVTKQYEQSSGSKYMTFRRVSENSPVPNWWHPGYTGVHAFETASGEIKDTADKLAADFFKGKGT